ncbi:cytochrome P450 [Pilobolus umbonatus]|nr:cytochrome P450 [Pilobolus umbonatus]
MDSILTTIKQVDNALLNHYLVVLETTLKKHKKSVTSISSAIVIGVVCRYLYRRIFLPPKHLQQFPAITYLDLLKCYFKGDDLSAKDRRIVLPLLNKCQGFYVQPQLSSWILSCTNPQMIKAILADTVNFPKTRDNAIKHDYLLLNKFFKGMNVVNTDGDDWKRHRQIINPFVHQTPPIELFGSLALKSFALMETIGLNNCVAGDITERMTLDAIGITAFVELNPVKLHPGYDFKATSEVDNHWVTGYTRVRDEMMKGLFFIFPILERRFLRLFPNREKAHGDLDELKAKIDEMIAEKRKTIQDVSGKPNHQKDLLTLMLEAEITSEKKLSTEEMKSNILIFFFAGHDTTANALTSAIGELARNKDIQKKAREEILRIMGDEPVDKIPTSEQLREMEYLDCIIKENLRLNPPAPGTVPRKATKDTELNNIVIPKGTIINIHISATHFNPALWENPMEYRPERFMTKSSAQSKDELKWLPFGYGPHTCLGMNFSITEQRVFLSMLLRKFEWDLSKESIHSERIRTAGVLGMKVNDLFVNFTKRYN